jgi:hypothetical protein
MRDLHNKIDAERIIAPQAKTTVAATVGKVIDLKGYEGCEIIIDYGTISGVTATLTPVVKDGDATGSLASVADTYLLGTEAGAGIASGTRTSNANKNVSKRIGYIGLKRYLSVDVVSTVTAATIIAVTAIKHTPSRQPVAT